MAQLMVSSLIELLLVLPIAFRHRKPGASANRLLLLFGVFFFVHNILLRLNNFFPAIDFIGGRWNWDGKLYSLVASGFFYWICKPDLATHDFVTLRQKPGSWKLIGPVMAGAIGLYILSPLLTHTTQRFDPETLAFQLTMPGLEEEFTFRGIMLGLLCSALTRQIIYRDRPIGHPGVWITALLFGLAHGFSITPNWAMRLDGVTFMSTFLMGWLLGWMTLVSRSIVLPILTHNLANFVLFLIPMLR